MVLLEIFSVLMGINWAQKGFNLVQKGSVDFEL